MNPVGRVWLSLLPRFKEARLRFFAMRVDDLTKETDGLLRPHREDVPGRLGYLPPREYRSGLVCPSDRVLAFRAGLQPLTSRSCQIESCLPAVL
jgi:hypothetical protein